MKPVKRFPTLFRFTAANCHLSFLSILVLLLLLLLCSVTFLVFTSSSDRFDDGRRSTRINTDAWLDEKETFWRETLQKLLFVSVNEAQKDRQSSGQIDSDDVLRQKMNSETDEPLTTNSNDRLSPTPVSIMRTNSAELTSPINETKSSMALATSTIKNSQISEPNGRITTAKNVVVEVEDKGISLNESSTFEMRFKNLNGTLSLSRPVQNCSDKTLMIIIVSSRATSADYREIIRQTWAKAATMPSNFRLYFMTGYLRNNEPNRARVLANLEQERRMFGDIILTDIVDEYKNLTLKVYAALRWKEEFCNAAKFFMKNDEDVVVHVERLKYLLENNFAKVMSKKEQKFIFGIMNEGKGPIRQKHHKWYVSPDEYPDPSYPTYINGPSYIITSAAVSEILKHTAEVNTFSMEDIFWTGVLGKLAGVLHINVRDYIRTDGVISTMEPCDVIGDEHKDLRDREAMPRLTVLHCWSSTTNKLVRAHSLLRNMHCENGLEFPKKIYSLQSVAYTGKREYFF